MPTPYLGPAIPVSSNPGGVGQPGAGPPSGTTGLQQNGGIDNWASIFGDPTGTAQSDFYNTSGPNAFQQAAPGLAQQYLQQFQQGPRAVPGAGAMSGLYAQMRNTQQNAPMVAQMQGQQAQGNALQSALNSRPGAANMGFAQGSSGIAGAVGSNAAQEQLAQQRAQGGLTGQMVSSGRGVTALDNAAQRYYAGLGTQLQGGQQQSSLNDYNLYNQLVQAYNKQSMGTFGGLLSLGASLGSTAASVAAA